MTLLRRLSATLVFTALTVTSAFAQNEPIVVEAEPGTVGSQFAVLNDGAIQYVAIQSTVGGSRSGATVQDTGAPLRAPTLPSRTAPNGRHWCG